MAQSELERGLKVVRELLVRAQALVDEGDAALLQGAVDRVDLVGQDLPGYPKRDDAAKAV